MHGVFILFWIIFSYVGSNFFVYSFSEYYAYCLWYYFRVPGKASLERAIENIKNNYLVVGILEDIPGYLEILEYFLPKFFSEAQRMFKKMGKLPTPIYQFWICWVKVYVCMFVCMHVRMFVCMYVCKYVCIYVCMHVCMYVCTHVCTFVCVCMYVCISVCMYVCMYACMYGSM